MADEAVRIFLEIVPPEGVRFTAAESESWLGETIKVDGKPAKIVECTIYFGGNLMKVAVEADWDVDWRNSAVIAQWIDAQPEESDDDG